MVRQSAARLRLDLWTKGICCWNDDNVLLVPALHSGSVVRVISFR